MSLGVSATNRPHGQALFSVAFTASLTSLLLGGCSSDLVQSTTSSGAGGTAGSNASTTSSVATATSSTGASTSTTSSTSPASSGRAVAWCSPLKNAFDPAPTPGKCEGSVAVTCGQDGSLAEETC